MWQRAWSLLEEVDRLQRQFFHIAGAARRRPSWEPPADVFETAGEVIVLVALPGVDPSHVEVEFHEASLVVSGVRRAPVTRKDVSVARMEIPHGRFERTIPLPAPCAVIQRRDMDHGCLLIRLRKKGA